MSDTDRRLLLWAGDGGLNARDEIVYHLFETINESIGEAREDSCFLNEVLAYLRCLLGVLKETGGDHLIEERIEKWEKDVLSIYDSMPGLKDEEVSRDRPFIVKTFEELKMIKND